MKSVLNSEKMTPEESIALVDEHQNALQLTAKQYKRWAGKRHLILIEVEVVTELEPFSIDWSGYGNMDDWLLMEDIMTVKI